MKHLLILLALTSSLLGQQAPPALYVSKNAAITLYSDAPMEDIEGNSTDGKSVYNASTGELAFNVAIRSFKFQKSLMQEHFNENYMESDKYPQASFKGKITEKPDITVNGSYPVTATGVLEVHGVKQQRTIKGKINVNNGKVTMTSEFIVKCADHKIEIPKLVFQKIAETLKITVTANYTAYNKNPTK